MRIRNLLPVAILLAAALAPAQEIAGEWHGSVDVKNDAPLRLTLHISEANPLKATLDSVDEGFLGLPVDTITVGGSTVKFEMKAVGGVFEGTIATDGSAITGFWRQDGGVWALTWERGRDPADITGPIDEEEAREKGRLYTQWFYQGRVDDLWSKLSPVMQQALVGKDKLSDLRSQALQKAGMEIGLNDESVGRAGVLQVYTRLAKFDKAASQVELYFAIDPRGTVADFCIRPAQRP